MKVDKLAAIASLGCGILLLLLLSFQEWITPYFSLEQTPITLHAFTPTTQDIVVPQKKVTPKKPKPKPVVKPKEAPSIEPKPKEPEPEPDPKPEQIKESQEEQLPPPQIGETAIEAKDFEVVELFSAPLNQFYPDVAWDSEKEGFILVKVLIDTTGHVIKIEVLQGNDDFGFVGAAEKWLKTVKFQPIKKDGKKVPFYYVLPIEFKLYE